MTHTSRIIGAVTITVMGLAAPLAYAQETDPQSEMDARVRQFLDAHRDQWRDANVPTADGQLL